MTTKTRICAVINRPYICPRVCHLCERACVRACVRACGFDLLLQRSSSSLIQKKMSRRIRRVVLLSSRANHVYIREKTSHTLKECLSPTSRLDSFRTPSDHK